MRYGTSQPGLLSGEAHLGILLFTREINGPQLSPGNVRCDDGAVIVLHHSRHAYAHAPPIAPSSFHQPRSWKSYSAERFVCLSFFFNVVIGPFEFRYVLLAESGPQGIEGQRWLASITPALMGHGRGENRTGRTKLLCSGVTHQKKNINSRPQINRTRGSSIKPKYKKMHPTDPCSILSQACPIEMDRYTYIRRGGPGWFKCYPCPDAVMDETSLLLPPRSCSGTTPGSMPPHQLLPAESASRALEAAAPPRLHGLREIATLFRDSVPGSFVLPRSRSRPRHPPPIISPTHIVLS